MLHPDIREHNNIIVMDPVDRVQEEKYSGNIVEDVHGTSSNGVESIDFSHVNERTLLLKIDLRILPIIVIIFMMAFIDRYVSNDHFFLNNRMLTISRSTSVNIGNARLFSLQEDLVLSSHQYDIALSVFFVSYCGFEIPANILMKKVKPHVFSTLSCCCLFRVSGS